MSEGNSTDSDTGSDDEKYRAFAGYTYLILSLISLFIYTVFLQIFARNYTEHFSQHPFYVLVQNLAAADIGYLLENVLVVVPNVFAAHHLFGQPIHVILCTGNTIFFYAITACSTAMALNRFSHFFDLGFVGKLSQRPQIYFAAGSVWLFATAVSVITTIIRCPKDFNVKRYHFFYHCAKDLTVLEKIAISIASYTPATLGVIILILYAAIFIQLRGTNKVLSQTLDNTKQNARNKQERNVLAQGAIIGMSLFVENIAFNVLPRLFSSALAPILMNWSGILNSMITPCVFIYFNKIIREEVAAVTYSTNNHRVSIVSGANGQ